MERQVDEIMTEAAASERFERSNPIDSDSDSDNHNYPNINYDDDVQGPPRSPSPSPTPPLTPSPPSSSSPTPPPRRCPSRRVQRKIPDEEYAEEMNNLHMQPPITVMPMCHVDMRTRLDKRIDFSPRNQCKERGTRCRHRTSLKNFYRFLDREKILLELCSHTDKLTKDDECILHETRLWK